MNMDNKQVNSESGEQAVTPSFATLRTAQLNSARPNVVEMENGFMVATMAPWKHCGTYAQLFAAAPALYEALKYAVENIQGIMDGTDIPSIAIRDMGLAALALVSTPDTEGEEGK